MSDETRGLIFNIQHFSSNDGPGIRTTVFFKGCPLRCRWCHNPESYQCRPQLMFLEQNCAMCGKCMTVCPSNAHIFNVESGKAVHTVDHFACVACGKCADGCIYNALEISGKYYTVDEVLSDVMRDSVFYETSGGGLTLSGGEPFAQFDFMLSLLKLAKKENLHICVETSGFTAAEYLREAAEFVDIFLIDFKEYDSELHREYTGVGNDQIISNIALLDSLGKNMILRCPIIPDLNTCDEHYRAIAEIAERYPSISEINIEGYHPLGISKSQRLGVTPTYTNDSFIEKAVSEYCIAYISERTTKKVIFA